MGLKGLGIRTMDRLTKLLKDKKSYIIDNNAMQKDVNGYLGDAVNRLGRFEDIYDNLISDQNQISKELEKLRLEGKTNSVKFKQLFANKLTNSNIISIFKAYGLE